MKLVFFSADERGVTVKHERLLLGIWTPRSGPRTDLHVHVDRWSLRTFVSSVLGHFGLASCNSWTETVG